MFRYKFSDQFVNFLGVFLLKEVSSSFYNSGFYGAVFLLHSFEYAVADVVIVFSVSDEHRNIFLAHFDVRDIKPEVGSVVIDGWCQCVCKHYIETMSYSTKIEAIVEEDECIVYLSSLKF